MCGATLHVYTKCCFFFKGTVLSLPSKSPILKGRDILPSTWLFLTFSASSHPNSCVRTSALCKQPFIDLSMCVIVVSLTVGSNVGPFSLFPKAHVFGALHDISDGPAERRLLAAAHLLQELTAGGW